MHFSYPQQLGQDLSTVPIEQISINQQRLTSFNVLMTLSDRLNRSKGITLNAEQLAGMLSTTAQVASRIIELQARGLESEVLAPVLLSWLDLYLDLLEKETSNNTSEELLIIEEKLAVLEEKIIEQRTQLQEYSEDNNIISLERDENRVLSRLKGLGESIDEADAQAVEAQSALASIKTALANGESLTRPQDQDGISGARSVISSLVGQLAELAERFTPQYMALDPNIATINRSLTKAKASLEDNITRSQSLYVEESKRQLESAKYNSKQLHQQLQALSTQAQEFNQKLENYRRQDISLKQLESQAQGLKDRLIQEEVEKPFVARINVLERPFIPSYPIGPNYWLDSAIAAGLSVIIALLSLLIFSFIVRQKNPATTFTSYNVHASQTDPKIQSLGQNTQSQSQLPHAQQPLQIQQNTALTKSPLRLLSEQECQRLFEYANKQGKLAIALLLSGVSCNELEKIKLAAFNPLDNCLNMDGPHSRIIVLNDALTSLIKNIPSQQDPSSLIWLEKLASADFDQLIINAGHDAEFAYPEQLSIEVLRHTYLTYLVTQGARLNDLEHLAGYLSPNALARYRTVNRHGESIEIGKVSSIFPFVSLAAHG
ncbi:MAG: succinoglycan biosynthesis transport protein ExoP [Paraglaciecola sp.]